MAAPDPKYFWITPAAGGVMLILLGVAILIRPEIVAYFIAMLFMFGGAVVLLIAWKMRGRVTYRRIDELWRGGERPPEE